MSNSRIHGSHGRGLGSAFASLLVVTVALLALTGARAGVISPQSGWYSGNPLLGPAALTDLACSGGICYGAGNAGTLLKSGDAGATWAGVGSGVQQDLRLVRIVGGKPDSFVAGGGCVLRRFDDGGKTVTRLPFTARDSNCPSGIAAVAFPTSSLGYLALDNGSVLATADGGRTFSRRTATPGGSANDLLCTADTTCLAVTTGGTIQRTTDGGVSWTQVAAPTGGQLRTITAASDKVLYAGGDALTLLKSIDGGATWTPTPILNVPGGDISRIRCADAKTCLLAMTAGNQVLRTTDGGAKFTSIVASSDPTFAVDFASATRAVAVGATGSAELSDDAGANWKPVGLRIPGSFRVLDAVSGLVAYAGGAQGVLARTVDSGQSWANISPPTSAEIVGIAAPTASTLFVLAQDGSLERSDNGGDSYRILDTGASTVPNAIVALDPDHVLLIGPRGVRRSTNGGDTFEAVADKVAAQTSLNGTGQAGNVVYAFGTTSLIASTDGGATWKKVGTPRGRGINDVSFGTASVGLLLDAHGKLWRTRNGGKSWRELRSLGAWGPDRIELSDASHGFALAGPTVLRTDDAGSSWHPQYLAGGQVSALQSSGGTAYALVNDSILYATTSGGDVGAQQQLTLSAKPASVKKPRTITLTGKLTPADGGEDVMVFRYVGGRWAVQHATVASNGVFTTRSTVLKTSQFVAQIFGDGAHAGAGTTPLTVKVGR